MSRPGHLVCRTLSLVITVSFVHLLLAVAVVPDAMARMGPVWSPPHLPAADTCVSPALVEAAWQEAMRAAQQLAETDLLGEEIASQLRRGRANGTLPFTSPTGCPERVVDPLTVMLLIAAAAMAITFIVWAIAMIGST
ncbi:MAG: hypothetical protein ACREAQ_05085 [Nitrososphaera sp.]